MPISPYSPCPGGSGKKIKFCCPELLGEHQKIEKMLDGEQFQACARHVEQLERSHPDKACVLALKTLLLRTVGELEKATAAAATFLEKHPENPLALAETAMLTAVTESGREAVVPMARAIAASGTEMNSRVYEAMGLVSRVLAGEQEILAARALASLQAVILREDRRPADVLLSLNRSAGIPLVMREDRPLETCPEDVPWKSEFDEALALANRADWIAAAEGFARLADRVGDAPVIWRNLASVRGWLADRSGCIDALKKYAALDVPLEDAAEAEALALFLSGDPLKDQIEMVKVQYSVDDPERLLAALESSPKVEQVPSELAPFTGEGPPPKAVFFLFDRPAPDADAEITLERLPRIVCEALFFGKETDRDARLEVMDVSARDAENVKSLLADLAADALGPDPQREEIGRISASQELLTRNWRLPEGVSQEAFQPLVAQYLDETLLETWPKASLGLLGGKSPDEVAGQEAYRVRLAAAILVIEYWLGVTGAQFDCNRLRSRLGLPALDPIDLGETPIDDVPLVRLRRVTVDKLPDEVLLAGYRRAAGYGVQPALESFTRAVVERPSLGGRDERLRAFAMMARMADDPDQALHYVNEGRKTAEDAGHSSASWDLLELSFRFQRGEGPEVSRLMKHIEREHLREPGVGQALTDLLVQVGVLQPDGTPAVPMAAAPSEEPSLVVPGTSGAAPGELWTPDSQKPAGEKPKIWTPGMD